jgi:hypothetical protein
VVLVSACLSALAWAPAAGAAAAPSAAWDVESVAYPTDFSTAATAECLRQPASVGWDACDTYVVTATNVGSVGTDEHAVTLTDALPPGVSVRGVSLFLEGAPGLEEEDIAEMEGAPKEKPGVPICSTVAVRCELPEEFFTRTLHHPLGPDQALKMLVSVVVDEPAVAATLVNETTVSGGVEGAGPGSASVRRSNTVESGAPGFGPSVFDAPFLGVDGRPDVQAGSHPYELQTRIGLSSKVRESPEGPVTATTVEDLRDVVVDLPVGLAGSGVMAPTCTLARLATKGPKDEQGHSGCPPDTIVGHIRTYPRSIANAKGPVYNILPERGYAAELGFIDLTGGTHVLYASLAPTPAGYVLRTTSREIPALHLYEVLVSVFGDPAARDESGGPQVPTFTNPSHCTGEPLTTSIHVDSWQAPGSYNPDGTPNFSNPNWVASSFESPPVSGCAALEGLFNPTIEALPESTQADSPTGLQVNLKVPQTTGPETLGTPPLRDAVVTLPEGMTVNPSQANGLQACSLAQVGMSASGVPNAAPPSCPDASKIGTVEVETPSLAMEACKQSDVPLQECPNEAEREKTPLKGSIYVARQTENPFGSLLAIYIVVNDPRTGVIVKLAGEVKANEVTGQLTTVFKDTPQFPFSELRTHFFGGPTASLRSPATCGAYTLTSELTPWSAPESGSSATPSSPFEITEGPGGAPCAHSPGEEPNAPSFQAGVQTPTAAAYSPLIVHLDRQDGSQNLSQISVTLPPGATGKLAGIPKCSDAQIALAQSRSHPGEGAAEAASSSCPSTSAIGTVTVAAGAGPHPFYVTGNAYLAGPYEGAPFSAVFVTSAVAGPFDLGVVVVRAALYIDPNTAQVTTRSDPLPTILQGIPLDVRSVTVDVNRPQFTLNPTNCTPMTVTGAATSTQGQIAPLSSRFQVGGCQALSFHPTLTASTGGKASKAGGASLTVKVTSGPGQANIAKTDLTLPKVLPSRLSTIQKACPDQTFNANPATCNEGSVIGTATVHTPLLAGPLVGPGYLVSHGGAAFPDVEFVLQGEGITLILDGKTDIKHGITYSRFETVPDAPVSTFEAVLPTGPHSALTASARGKNQFNLCGSSLAMPTVITAQNGAVINQTTKIAVTGCPKVKALTRAQLLAKALKTCNTKYKGHRKRHQREACGKSAHKKYGPKKPAKAKNRNK